jgi:hypothetical protein
MIRTFVLALVATNLLVSCVSSPFYEAVTTPEKTELDHDRSGIYPDDVRKDLDRYTNSPVAWAGIIRSTDAHEEDIGGKIWANSTFDHLYFDWKQEKMDGHVKLIASSRGEGFFRTDWHLLKKDPDASSRNAEKFAGKGKLAIVYGVPKAVDPDGTVVLEYRYLRVFDRDQFTTNDIFYGRMGEVPKNYSAPIVSPAP